MRKTAIALVLLGCVSMAGCGKKDGARASLSNHNLLTMTEYKLVEGRGAGSRVVEAGSGYEGKVRISEVQNKVRFLQLATPDRSAETVEVKFENLPSAKSSLFSALTESGNVVATKGTWLHENAVTAFRTRGVDLEGPSRIVSFKALPLTLYNDANEPITRPPGVPRRGKL